jgi:hypothetical protein
LRSDELSLLFLSKDMLLSRLLLLKQRLLVTVWQLQPLQPGSDAADRKVGPQTGSHLMHMLK